jgi:Cu(I)/Ag(I) efflux system membrane fusion protein
MKGRDRKARMRHEQTEGGIVMTRSRNTWTLISVSLAVFLLAVFFAAACKKSGKAPGVASGQAAKAGETQAKGQRAPEKKTMYRSTMNPNEISDHPAEDSMGMEMVPFEVAEAAQPQQAPKKKTMYRSTMNPNEISDHPGKDSMGMEMVPFEVEVPAGQTAVGGRVTVRISPEKQQLIGVTYGEVKVGMIHRMIRVVGNIDYVEPLVSVVSLRFHGWIEKLFVDSTGQLVKKGEALFEVYSPELVAAQQEYLLAVKASALPGSISSLLGSARERLRLWDISDAQIDELGRTGQIRTKLTIYAPQTGFVIEKNVLLGQEVRMGESLYRIADLSRVWVYGEIYTYEMPFIKVGQKVMMNVAYLPAETFSGKITYVYPYLNPETRTNRVRMEFANPGFHLKPEMYVNLTIHVMYSDRLTIPADAVLDSGVRSVAFVDIGNGYLEPRDVKIGVRGEDVYEVLAGVKAGERVVTSANFLVDSESSLKAALQQMIQAPAAEPKHD